MSYGQSAALQQAIFTRLSADGDLMTMVSGAVFDATPVGSAPAQFVALGPEEVVDATDQSGPGSVHTFRVSVATTNAGFHGAKLIAARVTDLLVDADLPLDRGQLISLRFLKAKARRVLRDDTRRIDLFFRARLSDDAT